jgi:hypothetical protein
MTGVEYHFKVRKNLLKDRLLTAGAPAAASAGVRTTSTCICKLCCHSFGYGTRTVFVAGAGDKQETTSEDLVDFSRTLTCSFGSSHCAKEDARVTSSTRIGFNLGCEVTLVVSIFLARTGSGQPATFRFSFSNADCCVKHRCHKELDILHKLRSTFMLETMLDEHKFLVCCPCCSLFTR